MYKIINSFNYQSILDTYQNVIVTDGISKNISDNITYIIKNNVNEDFRNIIFLRDGKRFSYLGLAIDINNLTFYDNYVILKKVRLLNYFGGLIYG